MAGEVNVTGRPGENLHDVVHRGGHACPPFDPGSGVVAPGNGVRDVRLRRDSMEVRRPLAVSGEAPKGRQDAIDRGVLAVSLHQGELPGDVVDEGDPKGGEAPGEGNQRKDLSDDLQDVDKGLPGGEGGKVLRFDDPVVVEDVAVEEQDKAPAVLPPSCPWDGFPGPDVPRLLP